MDRQRQLATVIPQPHGLRPRREGFSADGHGPPHQDGCTFDAVRAEGHEVLGATILRRGPIGAVNLRFQDGVTALYGKNGAGKSVLLRNLEAVLDGDAAPGDEDDGVCCTIR
jgi:hypothetical protein